MKRGHDSDIWGCRGDRENMACCWWARRRRPRTKHVRRRRSVAQAESCQRCCCDSCTPPRGPGRALVDPSRPLLSPRTVCCEHGNDHRPVASSQCYLDDGHASIEGRADFEKVAIWREHGNVVALVTRRHSPRCQTKAASCCMVLYYSRRLSSFCELFRRCGTWS